jgi:hypothetical protein
MLRPNSCSVMPRCMEREGHKGNTSDANRTAGRNWVDWARSPREADDPFGDIKGRSGEHTPPALETHRRVHSDRPLHGTRAGTIATASPCAEPGRSHVDLERGIFYRKPIGKRATKKRQTQRSSNGVECARCVGKPVLVLFTRLVCCRTMSETAKKVCRLANGSMR